MGGTNLATGINSDAAIAALAAVLGALDTAAATGAVTDTDLIMAYIKQLVTNTVKLAEIADGTDKYPASWAQDSGLAKLATKSDPAVISGYDNTTDSLEAIRDLLDSFLIDHLLAAADGTDVYPASVVNDSLLAKILSKGDPAAVSSFNNTTDSLEALADALVTIAAYVDSVPGATGILHEQADVPVTINSIAASETNVFDLSTASTRYVVRNLRLKSADPGVDTVTVKLYELINDVQVAVDTFAITTANFGDYHSLMDMFGVPALAGDNLKVTVQSSANTYAITGQYNYAKTNV